MNKETTSRVHKSFLKVTLRKIHFLLFPLKEFKHEKLNKNTQKKLLIATEKLLNAFSFY